MKKRRQCAMMAMATFMSVAVAFPSLAFYQPPKNKKGLLMSQQSEAMFQDYTDLNLGQVEFNLGTGQSINSFDRLVNYCKANRITTTMIVLNHKNALDPELVPDCAGDAEGVAAAGTYGFNVLTESGKAAVRRYASQVARHYSDTVSNWVIGNEVNDTTSWDYNGITDIDQHADTYAEAFRIFYEEIKKANPDAHVLIPFTMCWNAWDGTPGRYRVKDYLPKLNDRLKDLDYEIAWHPHPVDFWTRPEFMEDLTEDHGISLDINITPNINLSNIQLLTDYLQRDEMKKQDGSVRHVLLTEVGFTSTPKEGGNGEERQAAAIQKAYEITKNNPYIDGILLTRQVDAASQEAHGGAFGLWTRDTSAYGDEVALNKKQAWYVYQTLDADAVAEAPIGANASSSAHTSSYAHSSQTANSAYYDTADTYDEDDDDDEDEDDSWFDD